MSSTQVTETEPSSGRPASNLPVDRGWAWFVMLGAFINTVFGYGFIRSLSIFFLEFLDRFQESATVTTLAFGLNTATFSLFSILVPPVLLSRFSVRSVALAGAVLNAACIIALAFAPNMASIHVLFTALGISYPLMYISQVTLLGVYFKKRLSFSVATANLGLSIATMVSPPLTQILLEEYGLQGALLLQGGLNLHNIAACLLFRPPSLYASSSSASTTSSSEDENEVEVVDVSNEVLEEETTASEDLLINPLTPLSSSCLVKEEPMTIKDNGVETSPCLIDRNAVYTINNVDEFTNSESPTECPDGAFHIMQRRKSQSLILFNGNSTNSTTKKSNIPPTYERKPFVSSEINISRNNKYHYSSQSKLFQKSMKNVMDAISSSKSVKYLSHSSLCVNGSLTLTLLPKSNSHTEKTHNDTANLLQRSDLSGPEDKNSDSISLDKSLPNRDKHEKSQYQPGRRCCCCCTLSSGLEPRSGSEVDKGSNKSAYCHPIGILILLMAGIGINTQCGAVYMPSLGKEQGLTDEQAALLMTVIGASDLCKIGVGYFADLGLVRRIHIVGVCQFIIGVTFQLASFFKGFAAMVVYCVLFGVNTGVMHVLLPGITVDFLGSEFIGQIMSGYFLINGVVMSLTHVLIGWLKDETDSFIGGYHFIGALELFSVLVILAQPLVSSWISRDQKSQGQSSKS